MSKPSEVKIVSVLPDEVAAKYKQVENGKLIICPNGREYDLSKITLEDAAEIVATDGCSHLIAIDKAKSAK